MPKSGVEIRNNFAQIGQHVGQQMSEATRDTAMDISRIAKQNCPVDTGALRQSIYVSWIDQGQGETTYDLASAAAIAKNPNVHLLPRTVPLPGEALVGCAVDYWVFVEYGTSRQAAQPFITPAIEATRQVFMQRVGAAIRGDYQGHLYRAALNGGPLESE